MNEIIFFLLFIFFPLSIFLIGAGIWYFLSENAKHKCLLYQQKLKLKYGANKVEPPFSEWRYPVMFLATSGLVFVLIVTTFGIEINTQTGETYFEVEWDRYFDEDGRHDRWVYSIFDKWVGTHQLEVMALMIGGYYMLSVFFIYFYFEYCKWKWLYLKNQN